VGVTDLLIEQMVQSQGNLRHLTVQGSSQTNPPAVTPRLNDGGMGWPLFRRPPEDQTGFVAIGFQKRDQTRTSTSLDSCFRLTALPSGLQRAALGRRLLRQNRPGKGNFPRCRRTGTATLNGDVGDDVLGKGRCDFDVMLCDCNGAVGAAMAATIRHDGDQCDDRPRLSPTAGSDFFGRNLQGLPRSIAMTMRAWRGGDGFFRLI